MAVKKEGFTLLELMITMAVAIILLGAAMPSYKVYNANNKSTSLASALASSLRLAKSEAIQRNINVTVCPSNAAANACGNSLSWDYGWLVLDTSNNQKIQVYAANYPNAVKFQPGTGGTGASVTFNPIGFTQPIAPSVTIKPTGCTRGYIININTGGSINTQVTTC